MLEIEDKDFVNLFKSIKKFSFSKSTPFTAGPALIEIFAVHAGSPQIHRIGIQDKFWEFCGPYDYLIKEHRLAISNIAKKIKDVLE